MTRIRRTPAALLTLALTAGGLGLAVVPAAAAQLPFETTPLVFTVEVGPPDARRTCSIVKSGKSLSSKMVRQVPCYFTFRHRQ